MNDSDEFHVNVTERLTWPDKSSEAISRRLFVKNVDNKRVT